MKSVFHCFFSFLPELEPRHNERVASVFPLESRQLGLIPHVRNCFEAVDAGGLQSPIPIRTMSEVICHQFYPDEEKSQGNRPVSRASLRGSNTGSSNTLGTLHFMLEASRAKDWSLLRRLEWYGCVAPTRCTRHRRFNSP